MCVASLLFFFFFFQAEDGIRDHCVTGVQTCALPIWLCRGAAERGGIWGAISGPLSYIVPSRAPPRRRRGPRTRGRRPPPHKIGRASCRERVEISVVAGSLKKKREASANRAQGQDGTG